MPRCSAQAVDAYLENLLKGTSLAETADINNAQVFESLIEIGKVYRDDVVAAKAVKLLCDLVLWRTKFLQKFKVKYPCACARFICIAVQARLVANKLHTYV